jgi:HAD superfamily hydrolase (TIGR01509 family)
MSDGAALVEAPRAVLFDLDGTLLDTNYLHTLAWWRALSEAENAVPMSAIHRLIGMGSTEMVTELLGRPDDQVSRAHRDHFAKMHEFIRPLPGATELIRAVGESGALVVIVTSAEKDELNALLAPLDCDDAIDVLVHGDQGEAKPAPDLFQIALARAEIESSSALALGDSVWDVLAANRAGVRCIAVETGGIARSLLEDAGATAVYDSCREVLNSFASGHFGSLS